MINRLVAASLPALLLWLPCWIFFLTIWVFKSMFLKRLLMFLISCFVIVYFIKNSMQIQYNKETLDAEGMFVAGTLVFIEANA